MLKVFSGGEFGFDGNLGRMKPGHPLQAHTEPVPLTNTAAPQPVAALPLVLRALLSPLLPIQWCFSLFLQGEPPVFCL